MLYSQRQPGADVADPALTASQTSPAYRAFDASLDQHFVLDAAGRLVYANRALLAQWQKTSEQAVGRGLLDLGYSPEVVEQVHNALQVLLVERRSVAARMDYPSALGLSHALETVLTPVFDHAGNVVEVAGVSRDITERVRRDAALRARDARSTALLKLGDQLRTLTTTADLAFAAAQILGETLCVTRCGYGTVDPDAETILVERDWNAPGVKSLAGRLHHFRDYGSHIEDLKRGDLVVIADAQIDPRTRDNAAALQSVDGRAMVNMPVLEQGRLVALLYLNHASARTWSPEELSFVREVADRTRIAVERRRSEQAVAADLRDTRLLQDLGARWVAEGDVKVLFEEILAAAIKITRADGGTIQLLDEATQELTFAATHGLPVELTSQFERVNASSHSPCGLALASGERTVVHFDVPASEDPEGELRAHFEYGLLSAQSTPLVSRSGRRVGMFSTHWREHHKLSEREQRFLDLLGRQAADLIERTQAEQVLRVSERQLRDADRRKDEFIAMLAHELRNPLVPIRTGIELLKNVSEQPARVETIRPMMERQVSHMVRLIDDLLDVSRITSGKIQLHREPVTLASVVGSAVEANRGALNEAGLDLTLELPDPHLVLNVDPTRFAQVLANLLQNASKFTAPGGHVSIGAAVECPAAAGTAELVLTVSDSGVGIAAEMLPRVFDLFAQAGASGQGRNTGLGIGLALARRLIEMHGGHIEARSGGVGHGSQFVIRLPLPQAPRPSAGAGADQQRNVPDLRVVVIDDNRDAANVMTMLIETFGGVARAAYDGASGIAAVLEFRPTVVLLDIGMAGMDGYEVCRRLRQQLGAAVAVVALTGWGHEKDKRSAVQAGFDAHLTKPADPARLAEVIGTLSREVLQRGRAESSAPFGD